MWTGSPASFSGAVVLLLICSSLQQTTARSFADESLDNVEDVRRPIYRGQIRSRERKSDVGDLGRSSDGTTATPIGESLRAVTKQLLQPTDMVATDVRTPPRVRTKPTGEAKVEKIGEGIIQQATAAAPELPAAVVTQAPSPGLSTWILLSNDQTKNKPATQATIQAVEKPSKKNDTIKGKPTITKLPPKKVNSTTAEPDQATKSSLILQDSKFKNRTPVIVGKVPTTTSDFSTKATVTPTTSSSKKKIATTTMTTPTKFIDIVPTTSLVVETATLDSTDETSTTETSSTTTKRTRRPGTKKKKKNKNRRKRPTTNDAAESKITQDNNLTNSKIDANRPISTSIYNYLAREVMPTVGVGIVGLVLTAGLAGLFLYPFGGGIARRNYEKVPPPQNNYYYSDYIPHREDQSNVQPEEKIFTPSESLNHNSYIPSYDSKYNTNKFHYEHDYGATVNGYAGSSEYSTLPDSVKNPDFSLSDSSKYYSMDPVSSQYKLTEVDSKYKDEQQGFKDESSYPSLTEYASYTNAASVGTRGTYDNVDLKQNETAKEEDKSDKSQPEFSALVGSPQFTNTDFVGSVSLTGSYGTDVQRTGALASDHGPRSMKTKREVHDDFSNEIDSSDDKLLKKPTSPPPTDVAKSSDTTTSDSITTTDHPQEQETTTTTTESNDNLFTDETIKDEPSNTSSMDNPGSFTGFLKRLVQLKLKVGISLLRTTSVAVAKYFDNMATKMEAAVRTLEKTRRRSLLFPSRQKRDASLIRNKHKRRYKKMSY